MPPSSGRCPLRAHPRPPKRGRPRPFSRSPAEPPTIAPPRLGKPLRLAPAGADRRRSSAWAAHPLPARRRRRRRSARLRRGRERVASLRPGEQSPQRGYYYHPSRHSAAQPIGAGWAYQFIARLNFVRESWTTPVDVERVVPPTEDANTIAAEQVKGLLEPGCPTKKPRRRSPCSSSMRATIP